MQHRFAVALLFAAAAGSIGAVAQTTAVSSPKPAVTNAAYTPVTEYDPKRDAAKDIAAAVKEAQRTNKNVLIEIGGKWCVWCSYLDKFFEQNTTIRQYRDQNYVMVKLNFSPENKNVPVISKYGKVPGYPHIFVLDSTGKLLHSQETSKLEEGRGYNLSAIAGFLKDWAPAKPTAVSK